MKKLAFAAVWAAELALAGVAVAHGIDGTNGVSSVSATFSATPYGTIDTRTCTSSAGKTIAVTRATYGGTAFGSTDLAGTVTIAALSTIDTTDGMGAVTGTLRIGATAGRTESKFTAVYDHGSVVGTLSGHGASKRVQLLGNLSAGFSAIGGFTSGKIGGGTSGGSAVELVSGGCAPAQSHGNGGNATRAEGPLSAVTAASVTVGKLTCSVPASIAMHVAAGFHVGERVEIRCTPAGGTMTLVSIEQTKR